MERKRETFDHLLVHGRFEGGAPYAMEVAGGRKGETASFVEIVGEKGMLRLAGGARRGVQSGRMTFLKNREQVTVAEGELAAMPDAAANVAGVYAALRDDIISGTTKAMGFDHAARLTRMIEAVLLSSSERRAIEADGWPA